VAFKASETGVMIWVPDERRPVGKCMVITHLTDDGVATYCGTPFYSQAEMERHTARCAAQHVDEIRRASPRVRNPGFNDPEVRGIADIEEWLNRRDDTGTTNRQAVIEGRRRM
jgi:hypothetical protein